MNLPFRNILFVLASALAGFLSGLISPLQFGIPGAILGAALSLGAIALHPARLPGEHPPPRRSRALAVAILAGAIAGALILVFAHFHPAPRNTDFSFPQPGAPMRFAICLAYTIGLLRFYRDRQAGLPRAWLWFAATPLLAALLRAAAMDEIEAVIFLLPIGSLPFVALWLLAAFLADPAWTRKRWQRITAPAP